MREANRHIVITFIVAFTLNALWEFWHAQFYIHYQGDAITALILLRAAMVDSVIITITTFIVFNSARRGLVNNAPQETFCKKYLASLYYLLSLRLQSIRVLWLTIPTWLIISVLLEKWALSTHRWAYNDMMPIVPFVQTGLTPTIQLALLGTASWYIANAISNKIKA